MTRARHVVTMLVFATGIVGSPGRGAGIETPTASAGAEAGARSETRMLVVTGLGGDDDYARAFAEQGNASARHAETAGAKVTLLTAQAATGAAIRDAIAAIASTSARTDAVVVQLMGHGTFDGEHYRFNVPGPDPTAADLAAWLKGVPAKRQLAVIATSASGAARDALSVDGRAVITATRHGRERNASRFGGFWIEALNAPAADLDKDERISAAEAFQFAERAVASYYEDRQRIATEHPRLEGDAGTFILARRAPEVSVDPAAAHLVDRVEELTAAIEALRTERRVLTDDDYFGKLQELLLELAKVDRELKARQDASGADADAPFHEDATQEDATR